MHKQFVLFLTLIINLCLNGQSNKVDSLLTIIKTTSDKNKKLELYKSVFQLQNKDSKSSVQNRQYLEEIHDLAKLTNNKDEQAYALYELGWYYYHNNDFNNSFKNWGNAKIVYKVANNSLKIAEICGVAGENYQIAGDYQNSMKEFFEGLALSEKINNKKLKTRFLSRIGGVYSDLKEIDKSIEFYNRAIIVGELENLKKEVAFATRNLGQLKIKVEQYEEAIRLYQKANRIYTSIGDPIGIAKCQQLISIAYIKTKRFEKAWNSILLSDSLYGKLDRHDALNKNRLVFSELLFNREDYEFSISTAQNSLRVALNNNNYGNEIEALNLIFKNYNTMGYTKKALETHVELLKRKDEISLLAGKNYADNARLNYIIAKNISLSEQNKTTQANLDSTANKLENNTRILVVISLTSVLFLIALLFLLKQSRTIKNKNSELLTKNSLIKNQNREITKIAEELSTSNKEINRINENLETIVKNRTKDLENKNALLLKYSQMNSHDVRAPLARTLGLLDLLKESARTKNQQTLIEYLLQSTTEMDEVVKKMNKILNKSKNESKHRKSTD